MSDQEEQQLAEGVEKMARSEPPEEGRSTGGGSHADEGAKGGSDGYALADQDKEAADGENGASGDGPSKEAAGSKEEERSRDRDRGDREGRRDDRDRDRDRGRDKGREDRVRDDRGKDDRRDGKSSRRSRSRDRKSSRRSSRDRKSSRRSRSDSRDKRRRRSRSRSRDRKSRSSYHHRSRSKDRRRSRSRDKDSRRSRSKDHKSKRSPSESSDDGVGGYKPRKRQPVITNGPGTGSDPFASMRQQVVPNDPAQQLKAWQLNQLEARAMVLDQQAKSAATATSKTQREVYVGGLIPGAISGEALRTLFNSALAVQFAGYLMPGMDPVINVNLHPEGKYAFVEFRAPEMATAALALSGQVQLLGCNLSVARPSGYVDPSKAMSASQAANMALAAFKCGDMAALAQAALAGANLKGLSLPPHIEDPASAAMQQLPPGMVIDGLSSMPTTCLCFTGMVTADRLKEDEEYNNMVEDLKDQLNEFAKDSCVDLKVPRPYDPENADQWIGIANFGKIFAKLVSPDAASVCKDKIHGRLYGGQMVQVFFITEDAYSKVT